MKLPPIVAKKAKKPEHDQDNNYSPEHGIPFGLVKLSPAHLCRGLSTRQAFQNIESNGSRSLSQSWRVKEP